MMFAGAGRNRRGVSLVESLVAACLTWAVAALVLTVVARQRTVQAGLARRAEVLAAVRTARHVLGTESRAAVFPRDAGPVGEDSLPARMFRGVGLPCFPGEPGAVRVVVEGIRLPDPAKDSVLVLLREGGWVALDLLEAHRDSPVPCAGGGHAEAWTLSSPLEESFALARYFERGSYHVTGSAVRYRRGAGGRQPLTAEVLSSQSAFSAGEGGTTLRLVPADGSPTWRVFLGSGGGR